MKLGIASPAIPNLGSCLIVGLHWYNGKHGYIEPGCPVLAICFANGQLFLLRDENDDGKTDRHCQYWCTGSFCFVVGIMVDTGMTTTCCQWNHDGSLLAVTGSMQTTDDDELAVNALQLFSPFGEVGAITYQYLAMKKILLVQLLFKDFLNFSTFTLCNGKCISLLTLSV